MLALEIAFVLVLTLVNGALAMSELAVVSARKARLERLAEDGNAGAARALRLKSDPSRFLSTVQVGITLVGILAGAVGGATLAERVSPWFERLPAVGAYGDTIAFVVVVALITYVSLVIGELVPKRIALADPERIAAAMSGVLAGVAGVGAPVVFLLKGSTDLLTRLLRVPEADADVVTEEEVRTLIAEGTLTGVFEPEEKDLIEGVLRLDDWSIKTVMTPRSEIVWIDVEATADQIRAAMDEGGVSRLLVCEGSVDNPVGTLHSKAVLTRVLGGEPIDVRAMMEQPLLVPDTVTVLQTLEHFKRTGIHFAIIVDEYGTNEGIATLTDVLETIAGELPESGEEAEPFFRERGDGSYFVEGHTPIGEFSEVLGLGREIGTPDFHTAAGLVLDRLGRIPVAGDAFRIGDWQIEVADMDERRIDKLIATPVGQSSPEEGGPPSA
ncbi:hemolysin family protein [Propylenella binzhouense]|uniref:HlyC/CorC family transporter n=1 Tax=Propylenella binzhouense TaxID=2555902 RepID=A0A964WVD6_9HYPH|nr:hemolysin family protein [Propylenella binzhouense]MYZ50122.1 HlyC/CorC family transporter [Propylenella binzhouense]